MYLCIIPYLFLLIYVSIIFGYKLQAIWNLRESIPAAAVRDAGYLFTSDISLPAANYYQIVPMLRERIGSRVKSVYGFGHLGKIKYKSFNVNVF